MIDEMKLTFVCNPPLESGTEKEVISKSSVVSDTPFALERIKCTIPSVTIHHCWNIPISSFLIRIRITLFIDQESIELIMNLRFRYLIDR